LAQAQAAADDVSQRLRQDELTQADWHATLARLHELYALEKMCGASFGSDVWRAYAAGLALAANSGHCDGLLPEEALPLLQRLADDPRTQRSFGVRKTVELSLGVALRHEGRMHEARLRTAASIHFVDSTPQWRASCWIELAQDQTQLGEWGEAACALESAETELRELAARPTMDEECDELEFDLACARTRLEIVLGRPDAAAAALHRARELAQALGDEFTRSQLLAREIDLAYASDNDDLLIARLEEERSAGPLAPEHAERLAFAYLDARADDEEAQTRAAQLLSELASDTLAPASLRASAEVGLGLFHRRRGELDAAALALARSAPRASDALEFELVAQLAALAVAKGERGAALADELERLRLSYDRALSYWRSAPIPPDGLGVMNYRERRALVSELIRVEQLVDSTHGPSRALARILSAEALGSLARERGAQPVDVERARQRLCAPGRGLLLYVPGPERGYVFTVDLAGVEVHEFEGSPRWNKEQRELWRLLAQPPDREPQPERRRANYQVLIERLSRALLPRAVQSKLREWRELTVVGVDMLGYVPFECLLSEGRELGQGWALCYAPSVLLACELSENSLAAPRFGLRLVAAPHDAQHQVRGATRRPIEWDGTREQRLKELWSAAVRVSSGAAATYAALLADTGADLAVLEILAHGHYDPLHSPPAAIALTPHGSHSGMAYTSELARLHCPPIVALAVCGAARGPLRAGDAGAGHLGGALVRGGARVALLATLDIEQAATEELLDATYRELVRHGTSTAEALRRARVALAADERFADPYYRSLVHCHGQGHELLVAARPPAGPHVRWDLCLAVAATLAAAALALSKRARHSILHAGRKPKRGSTAG
jgi:hypothetical protein